MSSTWRERYGIATGTGPLTARAPEPPSNRQPVGPARSAPGLTRSLMPSSPCPPATATAGVITAPNHAGKCSEDGQGGALLGGVVVTGRVAF